MIQYLITLGTKLQQEASQPQITQPELVEDIPELIEDIPELVEDIPELVETSQPELVETSQPELVETSQPELVETSQPELVETSQPELVDEVKANVFHQLENIRKNLEDLQLQQNNIQNELKEQIQTQGVEISTQVLEQFRSEDLIYLLNKINEFGPVELKNPES
jgi:hypothetical protein